MSISPIVVRVAVAAGTVPAPLNEMGNEMQYLLLIYGEESEGTEAAEMTPEQMQRWNDFGEESTAAGANQGGNALHPVATATTVRVRGGETLTTDGPFAETKEQLGGYYLVECKDIDEAIGWAAKIPAADSGSIEVRPIVDFG